MNYPDKFIADVKEAFPNNTEMHKLADSGNEFLGRYLDDGTSTVMSVDTILLAVDLETLQRKARAIKKQSGLYDEWTKLFREQKELI
jgi:hypothetical protein